MILPYTVRLLSVCLASFFLIHLALSALARALAPWALGRAEDMAARSAAALLLSVRLFPGLLAAALVAVLCLPSFLSFENERGAEEAGIPFLIAAALGASIWIASLVRSVRAVIRSRRCIERCSSPGPESPDAVWLWESSAPFVGLAGVLRPRVIMSRSVAQALDSDQMAAALRHERAHQHSSDNFKRLLLLLAPEAFPGLNLFRGVDRAWGRFAEWAADDRAVAEDPRLSLPLAEALVRVARLGVTAQPSPLISAFVPVDDDITRRVDRLLDGPAPAAASPRIVGPRMAAAFVAAPLLAALNAPGVLSGVHGLLERLMH
jgi:hypothetical protein